MKRIRQERKKDKPFDLPDLLVRYAGAKVFKNEYINNFVQGEVKGPVVAGANTNLLSLAEIAILTRGPKFTVRRILCKERFLLEMEKCFVKLRWALKDKGLLDEVDFETMLTDEERKKIDELAEVEEAMTKSVFNHDDLVVDFRNLKATDVKHNTKIVLPGPLTNQQEGELGCWAKISSKEL